MIKAASIHHRFGPVCALRDISVEPRAGAITALIGPNAAGKSTLLRCLSGALSPTSGTVLLDGKLIRRHSAQGRASKLSIVPQKPTLAADFSVREAVELGRHALAPSPARVNAAMELMELDLLGDRPFHALSAGQQQRVVMARAIAQIEPGGVLLLDEPTAAMDVQHVLSTMAVLRRLADRGCTVVVSIHDLAMAGTHADDAWLLDGGQLVAAGSAAMVLSEANLSKSFGAEFEWVMEDGRRRGLLIGKKRIAMSDTMKT